MIYPFKLNFFDLAFYLVRGFVLIGLELGWVLNSFAQTVPSFAFPQSPRNDTTYQTQADEHLFKYRLPLSPTKRKRLLQELRDSQIKLIDYFELAKLLEIPIELDEKQKILHHLQAEKDSFNLETWQEFLNDPNQKSVDYSVGNVVEERFYPIFDFNRDGKVDMIIFPQVYFGPSLGYKMYARQGNKFEYVFDNSGNFSEVKVGKNQTILRFQVMIIESSETEISQTIIFDHLRNQCTAQPKLYYATQTKLPKQLTTPILVSLKQASELRFSPQINNTPLDTTETVFDTLTRVLKGNIVAEYRANDQAYQLATEGEWALVAFLPRNPPIRTSLRHGLDDSYYDDKGNLIQKSRIQPYLVGWVRKKTLK
jgi:hypothetical protein